MEKETIQTIHSSFLDVTGMYYGRSGSNDYSRRGIEIDAIEDSRGKALSLIWNDGMTAIGPGIESGIMDGVRTIRIHQQACPVRVRFRHYSEYVSYDWPDHNSSWQAFYWIRYESSQGV
jgi:hypothetical protein